MSSFEPTVATQPRSVLWSYRLYLVAAILGVVGIVLSLVLLPATIDAATQSAIRAAQGQDTQGVDYAAVGRGIAIGATVLAVAIQVVLIVLTVVFARKMNQGRNWARIVLLVLAVLQLFGVLGAFGVGALQFVLLVVAAILSFLPASNAWFRQQKAVPASTL
jgi:hypothetical protein